MQVCAEPVINGERFVRILERVEGKPTGYAGHEPNVLFAALDPAAEREQVPGASLCLRRRPLLARVDVLIGSDRIVWRDVRASRGEPDAYSALGPYEFSREQYAQALADAKRDARLD